MSEALDFLISRNLNYRVEYKWVFPDEVQELRDDGWVELRGRRPVFEPVRSLLEGPNLGFTHQVKVCRETLYARGPAYLGVVKVAP